MGETVKVMHLDNCTVRVRNPELSEKQMDRIKAATAKFLCEVEAEKKKAEDKTA
jgi:hypothetical protein